MHKIFGIKNNVDYIDREGAYLIPIHNNQVGVIQTSKGYFHPIQSYYVGEMISKVAEPMETDHKFIWIEYNEIQGKMFVEMQNWALEQCIKLYSEVM